VGDGRGAGVVVLPEGVAVVGEQLGARRFVAAVAGERGLAEGAPQLAGRGVAADVAELIGDGLGEAAIVAAAQGRLEREGEPLLGVFAVVEVGGVGAGDEGAGADSGCVVLVELGEGLVEQLDGLVGAADSVDQAGFALSSRRAPRARG
jgi:hypothetical protein